MKRRLIAVTLLGFGLGLSSTATLAHSDSYSNSTRAPVELSIDLLQLLHGHDRSRYNAHHDHGPRCYRNYPRRHEHWAHNRWRSESSHPHHNHHRGWDHDHAHGHRKGHRRNHYQQHPRRPSH